MLDGYSLFVKGAKYVKGDKIYTSLGRYFIASKGIASAGTEPKATNAYWKQDYEAKISELQQVIAEIDIPDYYEQYNTIVSRINFIKDLKNKYANSQKP